MKKETPMQRRRRLLKAAGLVRVDKEIWTTPELESEARAALNKAYDEFDKRGKVK
jgi:hypothetical protein